MRAINSPEFLPCEHLTQDSQCLPEHGEGQAAEALDQSLLVHSSDLVEHYMARLALECASHPERVGVAPRRERCHDEGAEVSVRIGIGDRSAGRPEFLTLTAAVLRSWAGSRLTPASSVFAGPELEVVAGWGGTIGVLKRVDGPGWRFSAGLVRAF